MTIPALGIPGAPIDAIIAIKNKIKIVEAGAQGEHKLQRGYMPEDTWSLHWIKNHEFSNAINKFLDEEIKLMNGQKRNLKEFAPFKKLY